MAFNKIVVHNRPHLDEIAAIWLLKKFGQEIFPGIGDAEIAFLNTGRESPDGRSAAEYEEEGVLFVGVGGGRFDDHPKNGECATTLVAKALGVNDDPALAKILKYVTNNDLKGSSQPLDVADVVQSYYQEFPDNPLFIIEWAMTGFEVEYTKQLRFFTATREEFERAARIEEVDGPRGKLKLAVVESDSEQIGKFARSEYGGQVAIIIQRNSSGNVQIFTNRKYGLMLYDVVQMIRLAEAEKRGSAVTSDWKVLASEGKIEGAEEWYFHEPVQALLNGSLTASDVPPTKLSLDEIKEMVLVGINPAIFEPQRAGECRKGVCTSTLHNPCPWYRWGLHRCRKIRYQMKNA